MPEVDEQAIEDAKETTLRYRKAIEMGDTEAFLTTLSRDVVIHSPITARIQFQGHEEVRTLMRGVFASIEDIEYFEDIGDAATRALFYRARVGGQAIEEATLVRLDGHALITEIRLWFRPLTGLTAVMARLGPALAREHGRGRGAAAALLASPLAAATRIGDALGVSLVRPDS
jgi:SnoaL-like domain